jgi:hypothetical protein
LALKRSGTQPLRKYLVTPVGPTIGRTIKEVVGFPVTVLAEFSFPVAAKFSRSEVAVE